MARTKVTTKFAITRFVDNFLTAEDKNEIGRTVTRMASEMIAAGQSPVRGERRYPGYKNPDKYPRDLKNKRPVNLYLTGEMLSYLGHQITGDGKVEWGIVKAPEAVVTRARVHNDGTRDDIARRPFIPNKEGETFAVRIILAVRAIYSKRLSAIVKKSSDQAA